MKKSSFFKSGSGSRKAFVSSFQNEKELKEIQQDNNFSLVKNEIFNKSSENMEELVDNCVSLTVTSPLIMKPISVKTSVKYFENGMYGFLPKFATFTTSLPPEFVTL